MRPKPIENATTSTLLRSRAKSTVARIFIPVAATMPNMMNPAPPSTHCGTEATMKASLRHQAEGQHDHSAGRRTPIGCRRR